MSRVRIAHIDSLPVDRGVAAVVSGEYVAIFRLADGELAAIDHLDPCSNVPVLARGLVGCVDGTPVVASPLHKQRFDLRTGRCLDDPNVSVRVWRVEVIDQTVTVAAEPMTVAVEPPAESAA
ncbi:nitrite reductase small subunit NirD [Ilumatobacter nonamiensis]|uniref:nitrite reductase small subunit NirD n=1 Tax=Ilumatobacter nonamiensis TaxID=467093 RepID=UPI000683DFFA|nr:nitrite reductase small subunit NirD [Ilumatobacter nonamiensis]